MINFAVALVWSLVVSQAFSVICDSDDGSLVNTTFGCIGGNVTIYDGIEFRSFTIKYATAPRFNKPIQIQFGDTEWQTLLNEDGIINATGIAPACMQYCDEKSISCYKYNDRGVHMKEDCLYLTVYTPWQTSEDTNATDFDSLLPVMFYIHGGFYLDGWSGSSLFNGINLVGNNQVVVVTINYRLGSFGFFYDSKYGFEGNYGYYDQIAALHWVKSNIEIGFGGDPNNIILFGESAGAMSVGTILIGTRDSGTDLYNGAIMESNPLGLTYLTPNTWSSNGISSHYMERACVSEGCIEEWGCDTDEKTRNCLLQYASSRSLLDAQEDVKTILLGKFDVIRGSAPWTPTIGSNLFPAQPLDAFANGQFNKNVPIIIGTNRNEGVPFIYKIASVICEIVSVKPCSQDESSMCQDSFEFMLKTVFGQENYDLLKKQYQKDFPCEGGDYRPLASKIVTEFLFVCPTRNVTQSISAKLSNVWLYNYNYQFSASSVYWPGIKICGESIDGKPVVCHSDELPIVFAPPVYYRAFTENDKKISLIIQLYWTHLGYSGAPPSNWLKFTESTEISMVFNKDATNDIKSFYDIDNYNCLWWDDTFHYKWLEHGSLESNTDDVKDIYFGCDKVCTDENVDASQRHLARYSGLIVQIIVFFILIITYR
eukprot:85610_1